MVDGQLQLELRLFLIRLDLVLLFGLVLLLVLCWLLLGHLILTGGVALLPSLAHFFYDSLISFGGAIFGLFFI